MSVRPLGVKRALDVTVCLLLLLPTLALGLVIALAIRLDSPGPVLFTQSRTGRDGRRFTMYKFRTMVEDADQHKSELLHLSIVGAPDFKVLLDPRVTRVGRWLRLTSLDELPQLLNVLRGDMSLVGPRPTSFHIDTYEFWHTERLETPPGMTGIWQIGARNEVSFDERCRTDIYYVRNRTTWMDVKIILGTVGAVLRRAGL
jgi:lipopolysaccharide/colanic/teichoic acid biosynthesis glycosyltransferase